MVSDNPIETLVEKWLEDENKFKQSRKPFLIY